MTPQQKKLLPAVAACGLLLPGALLLPAGGPTARKAAAPLCVSRPAEVRTLQAQIDPGERRSEPSPPARRARPAASRRAAWTGWRLELAYRAGRMMFLAQAAQGEQPSALHLFHQAREVAAQPAGPLRAVLLASRLPAALPPGRYCLRDGAGRLLARHELGGAEYRAHVARSYGAALARAAGELRAGRTRRAQLDVQQLKRRWRIAPLADPLEALEGWLAAARAGRSTVRARAGFELALRRALP